MKNQNKTKIDYKRLISDVAVSTLIMLSIASNVISIHNSLRKLDELTKNRHD